ncbi:MAG: endonuclease/exonuclease/phosphatase family protein [Bacteroidetes bacterium]|nr:endonuclease/exonuclease/phosphatase family protein [Bacteroidota bacterium]
MAKKTSSTVFTKIVFFVNILFAAALAVSYSAVYISPEKYWLIAFFGLAYPFLFFINACFVVFWMVLFKKTLLLSLIVILIGYQYINNSIQLSSRHLKKEDSALKVLTYNVRLFNVFKHNLDDKKRYADRDRFFTFIKDEAPDIMCFQEFFFDKSHLFKTTDTISKFQQARYFHEAYSSDNEKEQYSGAATFSKYPIINRGKVEFEKKSDNLCIFSDIVKGKDTIRIYNVHLESIRLSKEDEMFYEDIAKTKEQENLSFGSRKILSKLKHSFIKRASQARNLAEHIKSSPYPVILCGDFNDTPVSYAYHTVSAKLLDAFIESGKGIGNSYNGKFPSFRIDYILHSADFTAYDFEVKKADYSDHFPVMARILMRK